MSIKIFNICLLAAWLLIAIGAACFSVPAGLMVAGAILLALTLYIGAKFGLYDQAADAAGEKSKGEA